MKYENQFENILNKRKLIEQAKGERIQKPFRIPEEIWVLVRDEMRKMEDGGEQTTFNDLMLMMILSSLNINQNEKGEWKIGNRMSFDYLQNQKRKPKKP